MITCSLYAADLSRILGNALAMLSARSGISTVALHVHPDRFGATGSDAYIAGQDWTKPRDFRGDPWALNQPILVRRDDAAAIEQLCRTDPGRVMPSGKVGGARKAGESVELLVKSGTIEVAIGDTLRSCPIVDVPHDRRVYMALVEMFDAAGESRRAAPGTPLMLDPSLFARFGKVKTDKPGRLADLLLTADPGPAGEHPGPVLVKIGPTFRGLIQPIDRAVNAKNVGQEGLW